MGRALIERRREQRRRQRLQRPRELAWHVLLKCCRMMPAVEPLTRSKRGAADYALPTRVGTGLSRQQSKDCSRGFRGEQTALAILKWRGHRRASRYGVPMGTKYSGRAWLRFSLFATRGDQCMKTFATRVTTAMPIPREQLRGHASTSATASAPTPALSTAPCMAESSRT